MANQNVEESDVQDTEIDPSESETAGQTAEAIPRRHYNEIGRMHTLKGTDFTNKKQVVSWEIVKFCRNEHCTAYELCEYRGCRRCRVESVFLRSITNIIYRNFSDVLDEPTMSRVGLHLMPLYQNLVRLLIAEAGCNTLITNAKGNLSTHPVYKEIREHIKLIDALWRSLGLTEYFIETDGGGNGDGDKIPGTDVLAETKAVAPNFGKGPPKEPKKKIVRRSA